MDVLVPATPESLGYTRHICVNCNYSYLSDYVTSGDDGYIPEPEEPEIPEIHKHTYELHTLDDSENMSLIVMRVCACGDTKNGYFNVTFRDMDGNITERKETGNRIDYSEFYGQLVITLADETGEQLKTVVVTAAEKPVEPTEPDTPDQPDEPTQPDNPTKPDTPDTPDEPTKPDQPDEPTQPDNPDDGEQLSKGKNGVTSIVLFVLLIVLAGGGLAAYLIIRKKKNNNKQN